MWQLAQMVLERAEPSDHDAVGLKREQAVGQRSSVPGNTSRMLRRSRPRVLRFDSSTPARWMSISTTVTHQVCRLGSRASAYRPLLVKPSSGDRFTLRLRMVTCNEHNAPTAPSRRQISV